LYTTCHCIYHSSHLHVRQLLFIITWLFRFRDSIVRFRDEEASSRTSIIRILIIILIGPSLDWLIWMGVVRRQSNDYKHVRTMCITSRFYFTFLVCYMIIVYIKLYINVTNVTLLLLIAGPLGFDTQATRASGNWNCNIMHGRSVKSLILTMWRFSDQSRSLLCL